jgi:hypothetical protein
MAACSAFARRETKFAAASLNRVREDGVFSGYASLFGEVDLGNDVIAPGAFRASLDRRGASGIRMLFQHDPAQPIGVWTSLKEDAHGLRVEGRIATGSARGREVLELMRAGAVDGLSIGFRTVRALGGKSSGVRRIVEADLWEISVVTFPMLPGARIDAVKSGAGRLPSVREFERWLVRDAGLSRSEALAVIHKGFAHVAGERDAAGGERRKTGGPAEAIRAASRLIQSSLNNRN